jgi:pimeloyl-ACP methyl ester carboxylesterase
MSSDRQPLLLLPGLICDQTVWQQQIDALSDVAVCTCADYGSLDSLPAMAEHVLRSAPERFSIAGHSMGGRIALQIYRLAPDRVARIALLNTGSSPRAPGAAGVEEARKRSELVARAGRMQPRSSIKSAAPPCCSPVRKTDGARRRSTPPWLQESPAARWSSFPTAVTCR